MRGIPRKNTEMKSGNVLTKHDILRIGLKAHGQSTLGGRKVWFDKDILRLNYEGHGEYLGEFQGDDKILCVLDSGDFYLSNFDINNHYEQNIIRLEKFNAEKVWTAVLWDAEQNGLPYIKRFVMEATLKKQNFLGENPDNKLILLTDTFYPLLQLTFQDSDKEKGPQEVDAEQFIAVKGFKAKGKRLTMLKLDQVIELEPTRFPEEDDSTNSPDDENGEPEEAEGFKAELQNEVPKDEIPEMRFDEDGQLILF